MKSPQWINMGRDMALVDERGVQIGVLRPIDEQIASKIRMALRLNPIRSDVHVPKRINKNMGESA